VKAKEQFWGRFIKWAFAVLWSPIKTFDEIVKNPSVKGPLLIFLVTIPMTMGVQYLNGSRLFLEQPVPGYDLWTEDFLNQTSLTWLSNGVVGFDDSDKTSGNYSVYSSGNTSFIWLSLIRIEELSFSEEEENRLSFSLKWSHGTEEFPNVAVLQLFSNDEESQRFELDLAPYLSNESNIWINLTSVNALVLCSDDWKTSENSPSWDSITGVGFNLSWSHPSDLSLKVDDLFFGSYSSALSRSSLEIQLQTLWVTGLDFFVKWVILAMIASLAMQAFSGWKGSWRSLFFSVGYIYAPYMIYLLALSVLFLLLPPIFLPYRYTYDEYMSITQVWSLPISILNFLTNVVWTTILCTLVLKKMDGISWTRAFFVAFGAVVMSFLLASILLSIF
jgi:hypothetical protein